MRAGRANRRARTGHAAAEVRAGRTLSSEQAHEIRRRGLVDYVRGKINENLYNAKSQVGRVYRAMVDRIDLQVEEAEARNHTVAVSGGKLTINDVPVDVVTEGLS